MSGTEAGKFLGRNLQSSSKSFLAPVVAAIALAGAGALVDWRLGLVLAVWLAAWGLNIVLTESGSPARRFVVPTIFGITLLVLWQMSVRLFDISQVILPAPTDIWVAITTSGPILWADFVQTVVKGALSGYIMGAVLAIATAIAVDRSQFLQRGLLPVGNFIAALPIVGTAPILVMWFGFGWQSKAAVVVVMVFFPILVNTVAGLKETDAMQRDLMRTYAASYWQSFAKLRLPAALPFIFNGLKVSTTLALIGAIVAEFFGSPIVGMGFRIKTSFGTLELAMVWAEIAVAAVAGSGFYGLVTLAEKRLTFWHPSQRTGR
ncbi:ABC transporter permease [Nioella sp. MMSF_3534]|uniref:ABC transporter permease n=1 Tax=Nioella sp. MMSF_3534 TaxID=3046720 RepID=UPI00273ED75C|nr:ABC transporter permease [Nioella sp. MMSF_3534]